MARGDLCFVTGRRNSTVHTSDCALAKLGGEAAAAVQPPLSQAPLRDMGREEVRDQIRRGRVFRAPGDGDLKPHQKLCALCARRMAKRNRDGTPAGRTVGDIVASHGLAEEATRPFPVTNERNRERGLRALQTREDNLAAFARWVRGEPEPRVDVRMLLLNDHGYAAKKGIPWIDTVLDTGSRPFPVPGGRPFDAAAGFDEERTLLLARRMVCVCLLYLTAQHHADETRAEAARELLRVLRERPGFDGLRGAAGLLDGLTVSLHQPGWADMLRSDGLREFHRRLSDAAAAYSAEVRAVRAAEAARLARIGAARETRPDPYDVHQTHMNSLGRRAAQALAHEAVDKNAIAAWMEACLRRIESGGGECGRLQMSFLKHYMTHLRRHRQTEEHGILCRVVARIHRLHSQTDDAFLILLSRVLDMYVRVPGSPPGFSLVCPHGRVMRLLSVFDGLESGWVVGISEGQVRDYVGSVAAKISRDGGTREDYLKHVSDSFGDAFRERWRQVIDDFALGFGDDDA